MNQHKFVQTLRDLKKIEKVDLLQEFNLLSDTLKKFLKPALDLDLISYHLDDSSIDDWYICIESISGSQRSVTINISKDFAGRIRPRLTMGMHVDLIFDLNRGWLINFQGRRTSLHKEIFYEVLTHLLKTS